MNVLEQKLLVDRIAALEAQLEQERLLRSDIDAAIDELDKKFTHDIRCWAKEFSRRTTVVERALKLELKPGQVLVLIGAELSASHLEMVERLLKEALGFRVPVLYLSPDTELRVIDASEAATITKALKRADDNNPKTTTVKAFDAGAMREYELEVKVDWGNPDKNGDIFAPGSIETGQGPVRLPYSVSPDDLKYLQKAMSAGSDPRYHHHDDEGWRDIEEANKVQKVCQTVTHKTSFSGLEYLWPVDSRQLDVLAAMWKLERRTGEADEELRARIHRRAIEEQR